MDGVNKTVVVVVVVMVALVWDGRRVDVDREDKGIKSLIRVFLSVSGSDGTCLLVCIADLGSVAATNLLYPLKSTGTHFATH